MPKIKTPIVLFIVCGLICVLVCGLALSSWLSNSSYPDAREYLKQTIPAIVKNWDLNDLRKYSGKCLLKYIDGEYKADYKSLFERCPKKLGALKSLGKSKITAGAVFCSRDACTFTYDCSTPATFEKGKAIITTSIYLCHGSGGIESFSIEFE